MRMSQKIVLLSLVVFKVIASFCIFIADSIFEWFFGAFGIYLGFASPYWLSAFAYSSPKSWLVPTMLILIALFFVGLIPYFLSLFLRPAKTRFVSIFYCIFVIVETVILLMLPFSFLQIVGICLNLAIIHCFCQACVCGKIVRFLEKNK